MRLGRRITVPFSNSLRLLDTSVGWHRSFCPLRGSRERVLVLVHMIFENRQVETKFVDGRDCGKRLQASTASSFVLRLFIYSALELLICSSIVS